MAQPTEEVNEPLPLAVMVAGDSPLLWLRGPRCADGVLAPRPSMLKVPKLLVSLNPPVPPTELLGEVLPEFRSSQVVGPAPVPIAPRLPTWLSRIVKLVLRTSQPLSEVIET
jgi:hypothetical protein